MGHQHRKMEQINMTKRKPPSDYTREIRPLWSKEEITLLKSLAQRGIFVNDMRNHFTQSRTEKAIHRKLYDLNIPFAHKPKGFSREDVKQTCRLSHTSAKADFGYQPTSMHPDWSGVKF